MWKADLISVLDIGLARGFLGNDAKGQRDKISERGRGKWTNNAASRPFFLSSFVDKTSGCSSALPKLGAKSELLVPSNPIRKPIEKPLI